LIFSGPQKARSFQHRTANLLVPYFYFLENEMAREARLGLLEGNKNKFKKVLNLPS
jgi:hypothetical protein